MNSFIAIPWRRVRTWRTAIQCAVVAGFMGLVPAVQAQTTYTWNNPAGGAWTLAANWTPPRTTPASNDVIVFNAATGAVSGIPNQTIGRLVLQSAAVTTLTAGSPNVTLTIAGGAGVDLDVPAGTTLAMNTPNNLTLSLGAAATGLITGHVVTSGGNTQRLLAAGAGSLVVASGGEINSGASGSLFGTTSLNSVVFQSGSLYRSLLGSGDPFGATAPSSVVVFQTGSRYEHLQPSPAPLNGRTYANFLLNSSAYNTGASGALPLSMDTLTVTNGNLRLNLTTISIHGDIHGSNLFFGTGTPQTIHLNGSVPQTLAVGASFTAGSTLAIENAAGVTVQGTLNTSGAVQVAAGAKLTVANGTLQTGTMSVSGTFQVGSNATIVGTPYAYQAGSRLVLSSATPLTLTNPPYWPSGSGITSVILQGSSVTIADGATRTVSDSLVLSSGVLDAGSGTIALDSNARVVGGSAGSYVRGSMRRTLVDPGAPATHVFPVGDAGYAPLDVVFTSPVNPAILTVSAHAGDHPEIATSGLDSSASVNRYWSMQDSTGGLPAATVTFHYLPSDLDAGLDSSRLAIRLRTGVDSWSAVSSSGPSSTAITALAMPVSGHVQVGAPVKDIPRLEFYLQCADGTPITNAPVQVDYDNGPGNPQLHTVTLGPQPGVGGLAQFVLEGKAANNTQWAITTPYCSETKYVSVSTPQPFVVTCEDCVPDPPPCSTPPLGMISWFPLDEAQGSVARDVVSTKAGILSGGTWNTGSKVNNSIHLGMSDLIQVNDPDGVYDLTRRNAFSIDFWFKYDPPAQGLRVLLDRRADFGNGRPVGFQVYFVIHPPQTLAQIGLQIADGGADAYGYTNFEGPASIAPDEWHHIAITVDGRPGHDRGEMYYDGVDVYSFEPAGRLHQLTTTAALWIGNRSIFSNTPAMASIDEIEMFDYALDGNGVRATAGVVFGAGKCKEHVTLPEVLRSCFNGTVEAEIRICNESPATRWFSFSAQGPPPVPDLFQAVSIPVPGGECVPLKFKITPSPPFPSSGGQETYELSVTSSWDEAGQLDPLYSTLYGTLKGYPWDLCGIFEDGVGGIAAHGFVRPGILFTNYSAAAKTLHLRWEAVQDSVGSEQIGSVPARNVRLGTALAGEVFLDSLYLPAGASDSAKVSVNFEGYDPYAPVELLCRVRNDSTGFMEAVGSMILVQGSTPAVLGVQQPGDSHPRLMLAVSPNPSRGGFLMSFALPRPAAVWLDIFDVTGRRVRRLLGGQVLEGERREQWDGRDAQGQQVGAGLYFAKLRAGAEITTTRLVTIR